MEVGMGAGGRETGKHGSRDGAGGRETGNMEVGMGPVGGRQGNSIRYGDTVRQLVQLNSMQLF